MLSHPGVCFAHRRVISYQSLFLRVARSPLARARAPHPLAAKAVFAAGQYDADIWLAANKGAPVVIG